MQGKNATRKTLALLAILLPASVASAVEQENFVVRNAKDLIDVCTTPLKDPLYVAAVNFCTGYLVGAYQFHDSWYSGPGSQPLVCPPNPRPTRTQAIADFIAWAKAHPEYNSNPAVDVLFRFLIEQWPCAQGQGTGTQPMKSYTR